MTADDGAYDSRSIAPGGTDSHAYAVADTCRLHCTIHPGMNATVIAE